VAQDQQRDPARIAGLGISASMLSKFGAYNMSLPYRVHILTATPYSAAGASGRDALVGDLYGTLARRRSV
jgi:hypothetical protein